MTLDPAESSSVEQEAPTILVVDDEPRVREVIVRMLEKSGEYRLLEAGDGVDARGVLQAQPVDVVVVDLLMPRMDGLALMKWAREDGLTATWIILSGRGTFGDAIKAVQLGAFDFITKPLVSPQSLTVTVRNALRQRHLAAERHRLTRDIEQRNEQLNTQVAQLQEACKLLCRQQETIDADLHRAELIQRALLPCTPPPLGGFAVDAVYRASSNVGGDLYDVVRVDERHVVVYVADAAGHGVSAAMLAVLFKHRIGMTDETHAPVAPSTVLERVNAHIRHECSAPGLFVTAAYCLLDTHSGRMTVASAGHPPLVVLRADGQREMIYHTGSALGLSDHAVFADKAIELADGDRVLLYTDGLQDLLASGERPACEQLADVLEGAIGDGRERLHQMLDLAADRRGPTGQEDDVTALLLSAGQSSSSIDNGEPTRPPVEAALPPGAEVFIGRSDGTASISVAGRGCWTHCAAFHDACFSLIRAHCPMTLDLSLCEYLDSTFLGTLQEIADLADNSDSPLRIQGSLPVVRKLFEELGMQCVLDHFVEDMQPLPARMEPLTTSITDEKNRQRMLQAHEALAALNRQNRQEFTHLIEHLQKEIQRYDAVRD